MATQMKRRSCAPKWRRGCPKRLICLVIAMGAFLCASTVIAQGAQYHLIDLGPIGFEPDPDVHGTFGINNLGQVAFALLIDGEVKAAIWLPEAAGGFSAGTNILPLPDGYDFPSIARDLNTHGRIVGQVGGLEGAADAGTGRGVIWTMNPLDDPVIVDSFSPPTSPFSIWSRLIAIDERQPIAVVLGESSFLYSCAAQNDGNAVRAFVVGGLGGDPFELGPGFGGLSSQAGDIVMLASGGVSVRVGSSSEENLTTPPAVCAVAGPCQQPHGYNDNDGPTRRLGAESHEMPRLDQGQDRGGYVRGINTAGQTVGWSFDEYPGCHIHAPFWGAPDAEGVVPAPTDLPMPSGQEENWRRAEAINNLSEPQVVGQNISQEVALLWDSEEDQGDLSWTVTQLNATFDSSGGCDVSIVQAHDINDEGWIVAVGLPGWEPPYHAYLLVPPGDCPRDLDGDGDVDSSDLDLLIDAWGPCPSDALCKADLDFDCDVGFSDIIVFYGEQWGPCGEGMQAIPPVLLEWIETVSLDDPNALQALIDAMTAIE